MRLALFSLLALAACGKMESVDAGSMPPTDAGFDAGPPPVCLPDRLDAGSADAGWDGGYDFSCRGVARPGGGQAELVLTGVTTRAGLTSTPLSGVLVELLSLDGRVLASTTSAGDAGSYRLTFDAGCFPVDGEVRATSLDVDAGFAPAFAVPDLPWRYDRGNLELVLFDVSTQTLAALFANVQLSDGGAALALSVEDCGGNPVEGVEISTNDAGVIRYVGASGLPSSMFSATTGEGQAVIFNLYGTSVNVTATRNGTVIGQRTVPIHEGAASGTTISP
jgi:hypothetical protein